MQYFEIITGREDLVNYYSKMNEFE